MCQNDKMYLPNSAGCFICGDENEAGLRTRFFTEDGKVKTRVRPKVHHCGFEGVVHGGIVAAILDECMSWAAIRAINRMCQTGELTVRYLINVPDDRDLICVTDTEKANKRLVYTVGELIDDEGIVYATASAKFTPLTIEATLEVDDMLKYQGGDERVFDELRAESENKS